MVEYLNGTNAKIIFLNTKQNVFFEGFRKFFILFYPISPVWKVSYPIPVHMNCLVITSNAPNSRRVKTSACFLQYI